MKFVALFLVSVALFSAADSAPSNESRNLAPEKKDTQVVSSSQGTQDLHAKKNVGEHATADPKAPVILTAQSPIPPSVKSTEFSTTPDTITTPTTPITTTTPSTTLSTTTTSKPPPHTTVPTTSTTSITTAKPSTTSSVAPSTVTPTTAHPAPVPTLSPTSAPKPAERHFDGPSFIGGAVLILGLGAISGVLYMFYKARTDQNYRTL